MHPKIEEMHDRTFLKKFDLLKLSRMPTDPEKTVEVSMKCLVPEGQKQIFQIQEATRI